MSNDRQEALHERQWCPDCQRYVEDLNALTNPATGDGACSEACPRMELPEYPTKIGDTCCGECLGGTCYVDQLTGA